MADFYVHFGSTNAKLLGVYRIGKINIKLHKLNSGLYIISKNRKIMCNTLDFEKAYRYFQNSIYLEDCPSLLLNN